MQRDINRLNPLYDFLKDVHQKNFPDWIFFQFIVNFCRWYEKDPFYMEDEQVYDIFNAKDFGVPQNRERLFMIGNRIGVSSKEIIKNIHKRKGTIRKFTLGEAICDLPILQPNRKKNSNKEECAETGFTSIKHEYQKTPFYTFINGEKTIFLYIGTICY